jgi:asparagine synthase (glutamine-hydrolysing)
LLKDLANRGTTLSPPRLMPAAAHDPVGVRWDRSPDASRAPHSLGHRTDTTSLHELHCLGTWGFIANRAELARDVSASESLGDQELLLRCCEEYGSGAAEKVAGPFSWIVWDGRSRKLIAARDRTGVHSVFFAAWGAEIQLAGSVDALLDGSPARPAWNERALVAHVQGNPPPPGETFYAGIRQLEPGELLTVTVDRFEVGRYWRLEPAPALLRLRSDNDYAAAYRELLFEVAAEYAPEVPAGITLSGGLDSTSLAVALTRAVPASRLTAVRWVAPELPDADESDRSAMVARRLGLADATVRSDRNWTLRGVELTPPRASPFVNFYEVLWGETFECARSRGLQILFTGASGDHLFGCGVTPYADLWLTGRWNDLTRQLRADPRYRRVSPLSTLRQTIVSPIAHAWGPEWWRRRWAPVVPWLGERYRKRHHPVEPRASRRLLPGRQHRLEVLRQRFLPHVMAHTTAAAARRGVTLRHPLLDHRLFEFAASLPADQSFRAGEGKTIVRNALRGLLPAEVIEQRGKVVPTPISRRGLAEREQEKVWPLLSNMRTAALGVVDEDRLRAEYRDYVAGVSRSGLFWYALTCEAWLREHFG